MINKTQSNQPYKEIKGITDCHMHMIGQEQQFPFSLGREGIFKEWISADYLHMTDKLGIERYVLTQTPFYGFDNRNLLNGLQQLGERAKGIAVVNADLSDKVFLELQAAGVVGANFFLMSGGELDWSSVEPCNERIQDYGWQTQLQFNGHELDNRFNQSDWPDPYGALSCLKTWGASKETIEKILVTTPEKLFGFTPIEQTLSE